MVMEHSFDAVQPSPLSHKSLGCSVKPEPLFNSPPRPSTNSWLELQVFYVRVSCPCLQSIPELLNIRYSRRSHDNSWLEINRKRVSSCTEAMLALRLDRMDASEAVYVCTDSLRTTGSLSFKICDNEDMLICGSLTRSDGQWLDRAGVLCKEGWFMECTCMVPSSGCAFTGKKGDDTNILPFPPSIEVCAAGRHMSSPVILTQMVNLIARRRHVRQHTLDAIPELEEYERMKGSLDMENIASQMEEQRIYRELDLRSPQSMGIYERAGMPLGDDNGDLSWFNTGVRVGVGIGLGMCVGLGVGFGLLMRGYQTTTKALRRKLL